MKDKSLIKFVRHHADLKPADEIWFGETFSEREEKILKDFYSAGTRMPSSKMNYVRRTTIPISSSTQIDDLKSLADKIHIQMGPECFQIVIKRTSKCAYLLFDFYDRKMQESYWLNPVEQKYLIVLIVRSLKLDASIIPDKWLRYYFVSEYQDDPLVFKKNIQVLQKLNLGKKTYRFMRNALKFAELVSCGILKGNAHG